MNVQRYGALDGLRGIAAIAILIYHCHTVVKAPDLLPRGYLAVDFFFMLSGFVVAHAYKNRLSNGMTFRLFVRKRLIRFLPISMLGVVLGFGAQLYFLTRFPERSDPLSVLIGQSLLNLALIPKLWVGPVSADRLFPGNNVLWSLFFEMFINIAWAAAIVRLKNKYVATIAILSGLAFVVLIGKTGTANLGWNWSTSPAGFVRVTFGFCLGLLLYEWKSLLSGLPKWCPLLAALLLPLALAVPWRGAVIDAGAVVILLPAVMILGAVTSTAHEALAFRVLGEISFPLYAIHTPFLLAAKTAGLTANGAGGLWFILAVALGSLPVAWLVGKYYDEPVRRSIKS